MVNYVIVIGNDYNKVLLLVNHLLNTINHDLNG